MNRISPYLKGRPIIIVPERPKDFRYVYTQIQAVRCEKTGKVFMTYCSICFWCGAGSPALLKDDDLLILQRAKKKNWRADRQADGQHTLVCPACRLKGK